MNQFCKLPAWLRIAITVVFLAGAIAVGIMGRPSPILAIVSLVLFVSGAWRLSRVRVFVLTMIVIPLLMGLLLAGFDWHHPFLARYSAGLFSVIAVLLLMDAVRIEEWIEVIRKNSKRFHLQDVSPVLIGTAVGIVSLSSTIQEQRACRKLAGVYRWRAKSHLSVFLDSVSLPFYNAVESHEFIDEALRRWSSGRRGQEEIEGTRAVSETRSLSDLRFGNSIFAARLKDVYDFPYFTTLVSALSRARVLEPWEKELAGVAKGETALVVNERTGQLTRRLLQAGLTVTACEEISAFREELCRIQQEHGSALAIATDWLFATSPSPFDHVFFHQNAFLEKLNEMETRPFFEALSNLSKPGTQIFFTYPSLEALAPEGTIFAGCIPGIGDIDYRYAGYERAGETAEARLAYRVKHEHDSYCVQVPVKFRAPGLSDILLAAESAGFRHQASPMPPEVSLFPGGRTLVELSKQDN